MKPVELIYLSRPDIERIGLTMRDTIGLVEPALHEHGLGQVEMPPKPGVHPLPQTFIHAMPAYIPKLGAIGLKWVGCFPDNFQLDLEQTTGVIVMNDPQTGLPLAVMDCSWVTAMRTAAVTAIGAKYLARRDSKVLGIVGAGVQGRTNLIALQEVLPDLNEVRVFDKRPEVIERYIAEMSPQFRGQIAAAKNVEEAVRKSDVVVTATMFYLDRPFVKTDWFTPGMFAAPLEADYAWEPAAVKLADKFVTDDWEQTRYFAQHGCFPEGMPKLHAQLGEIVCGKKPGRERADERIMAMNLGMAIEDVTVGKRLYELALERGIGDRLPLM
jgi:ornithine cyclodeaminase/alanine dehydrogenase